MDAGWKTWPWSWHPFQPVDTSLKSMCQKSPIFGTLVNFGTLNDYIICFAGWNWRSARICTFRLYTITDYHLSHHDVYTFFSRNRIYVWFIMPIFLLQSTMFLSWPLFDHVGVWPGVLYLWPVWWRFPYPSSPAGNQGSGCQTAENQAPEGVQTMLFSSRFLIAYYSR